jgi:Opioid growth factor receptor (OGFr) conserved region
MQLTAKIVPFYLGEQQDSAQRTIQEIWAWDFEELEIVHDYIQWLFPLPEKSAFNSDAPIVNDEVIQAFQTNPQLRQNLRHSFTVMLRFYGLQSHESEGKIIIYKSQDYLSRKHEWVSLFNHNYLRITRILKCLVTLGLPNEAQALYKCLQQIYQEDSDKIGSKTFQYWTKAVKPNPL